MASFQWELGPAHERPILTAEEAIEIALSDPLTSPKLRGLPVDAQYGHLLHAGFGGDPDVWRVSVDVSSLGWEMTYEGPGRAMVDGEVRTPQHVQVPKVRAAIIIVDDKMKRRVVSADEPDPEGEHRIEWR